MTSTITNDEGSGYYGRGFDTPLLDGSEPETQRPSSADITEAEATRLPGETIAEYVERVDRIAAAKSGPTPPVTRAAIRNAADGRWVEQHARRVLAERGINRPTNSDYRAALADAYALLVKARTT